MKLIKIIILFLFIKNFIYSQVTLNIEEDYPYDYNDYAQKPHRNIYLGCISGNCENGYGTYIWPNGDRYDGFWKYGDLNGIGIYIWANGDRYDGNWINGTRNGDGVFTYINGDVESGYWQNGELKNVSYKPSISNSNNYDLNNNIKNKISPQSSQNNKIIIQKEDNRDKVDKDIPQNNQINENTFVLIISNENYQNAPKVNFASNDGEIFKLYCEKTLGIPNENIQLINNGTFGQMKQGINSLEKRLQVFKGEAKAIFYYSGHGMPNEIEQSAYMLPVDGSFTDFETAISIKQLYEKISSVKSKQITIFLDACFSGNDKSGQGLLANKSVGIKIKPMKAKDNMIVFSASAKDETAYSYNEKQHSMFTYFLLKKLQESKGNCTLSELYNYINSQVEKKSIIVNNKLQSPQLDYGLNLESKWIDLKLK